MATTTDPERWAALGKEIAARREHMGLEQRQLAEAAGVSTNTISNYERGRVPARGKVPAGYYKVEKALRWSTGSVDAVLSGGHPSLEVEGPPSKLLRLRPPDDPELKENPLLRDVVIRVGEALEASNLAMLLADMALRWEAPEELIENYKRSMDALLASMFLPGHGPEEVRRYHEAVTAGKVQENREVKEHPELGWIALAARVEEPEEELTAIGKALKEAREANTGLSIEEMSEATKAPEEIIEMIERGDFSFFGAAMHAPTYIRLMASRAGVDSEPLVDAFYQAAGNEQGPTTPDARPE